MSDGASLLARVRRATLAIDEQRVRQSLHARLVDTLGADEAALLMEYLPPVGWADVATKRDLETHQLLLTSDIERVRAELSSEIGSFRVDVRAQIAELKSTLLMWLVPTVIGSVAAAVTFSRVV